MGNSISIGLQNKKDVGGVGSGRDVFEYGRNVATERDCRGEVQNANNAVSNHSNTMSFDSGK